MKTLKFVKGIGRRTLHHLNSHVADSGAQYFAFGVFGILNYPLSFLMWNNITPQHYTSFTLRLIATILCTPLVFHKSWPDKIKKFLPLYWYLTILYCLPFFGSFMLLENHASYEWLMNAVLGLFLFIILVDWFAFIMLLIIGPILGWLCFSLSGGMIHEINHNALSLAIYMYLFAIIIGATFVRGRENIIKEKMMAIKTTGASIAHELRTPLSTIQSGLKGLEKYFPVLIHTYQRATRELTGVPTIRPDHFEALSASLNILQTETRSAFLVIEMLLTNVKQNLFRDVDFKASSIHETVTTALCRYPFRNSQKRRVHYQESGKDFIYYGKSDLTVHVLFNLLKNALYFIEAAGKGHIEIWFEEKKTFNELHFKDYGLGMSKKVKKQLFQHFYSETPHGSGVGLAFCKMVMNAYGGDIYCESRELEFTEFTLRFPIISKTKRRY